MFDTLTLERWKRLSSGEQAAQARRLARELPEGFAFRALRLFELGDQRHSVALFGFEDATFVLIPGGTVTLGFDLASGWEPTVEELESWQATAEEYEVDLSIHEQVEAVTLRPRTVQLPPLLMENSAEEIGWEALSLDDPPIKEMVEEHFPPGSAPHQMQSYRNGGWLHLQKEMDGTIRAQRARDITHGEFAAQLADAGFRLPTSDEWEYACGAGAATLFRWGNHVPCNRYPTAISREEAAWRRQWVLSAGTLPYPEEGFVADWDHHRRPNAFGLYIASNPYHYELVAEAKLTRGGDGGCTICGGAGFFVGWLTLATAYFDPYVCERDPEESLSVGYTVARRVLPLD